MCLCDTPGTVMLLGVFCLINNVLYLIAVFFAVQILEALAPQLATGEASAIDIACTVAFISYYGGSCLLSIGLIWGANSLNRGLLQKVVLGTKIRLVLVIFLVAFKIYVLSRADPNDPLGIDKATSIKHRSMGNDSWDMEKYANLDPKTMLLQSIIYLPLAQKIPDNKPTDRKPDKKDKDDEENKPRQKVQSLVYAAAQDMLGFFLEVFIVYRLDLFVKRLPQ
ncbi:uncharacterized protein LOC142564977 isoform X3 [Dermacentor variabilis]|uniref:uncharacterized protein LOC142564977 isoform X3 n=1 Tax=Dermacentor variabilis TaxID=34621 RepID=UPI003F5CAED8